jgi:hypothetical protein
MLEGDFGVMSIHNMLFFERLWLDEPHERARGLDANHFLLNRVRRQTTEGVGADLRVARDTTRSASHNVSSTLWVRTVRASKIFMAHNSRNSVRTELAARAFTWAAQIDLLGETPVRHRLLARVSCQRPDPRQGANARTRDRGRAAEETKVSAQKSALLLNYTTTIYPAGGPNASTGMDRHHDSARKV